MIRFKITYAVTIVSNDPDDFYDSFVFELVRRARRRGATRNKPSGVFLLVMRPEP